MTLREQQSLFAKLVIKLLQYAHDIGYEVTLGEVLRSDEQAVINSVKEAGRERIAQLVESEFPDLARAVRNNGKANGIQYSIHQDKLAIDINIFINGKYLEGSDAHAMLGAYWKTLHPLCRWGGDFRDGNHYSMEYQGRK